MQREILPEVQIAPELIQYIFSFTDLRSLSNFLFVCKEWSEIAKSDYVWKRHVSNLVGYNYQKNAEDKRSYREIYRKVSLDLDKRVAECKSILEDPKNVDTFDLSYPHYFIVGLPDYGMSVSQYIFAKAKKLKTIFDKVEIPAAIIKRYLDQGGDPNFFIKDPDRNEDGPSLCYIMTCIGDLDCLQLLFNAGMNVHGNLIDYSPLHLVARGSMCASDSKLPYNIRYGIESENDLKVLDWFIQQGADVTWCRETGTPSPLSFAVYHLRSRSAQRLIDAGASLEAEFRFNMCNGQTYYTSLIERLKSGYLDLFPCSAVLSPNPDEVNKLILNVSLKDLIKEAVKIKLPTIQAIIIFKKMLRELLIHEVKISPHLIHEYELASPSSRMFQEFLEKLCLQRETKELLPEFTDRSVNMDGMLAKLMQFHQLKIIEIPASSELANSQFTMMPIPPGKLNFDPSNPTPYETSSPGLVGIYVESSVVLLRGSHFPIPQDFFSLLNSGNKIPCLFILCKDFNLILGAQGEDVHKHIQKVLFVNYDAPFELTNIDFINELLLNLFQQWRTAQPLFTEDNHPNCMLWELGRDKSYHFNEAGFAVEGPPPDVVFDLSKESTYGDHFRMYKRKRTGPGIALKRKDENNEDDNNNEDNKKCRFG